MPNNADKSSDKSIEQWLWDAACSIRGAKDAPKYKDYILPLVFAKRLCDVYDDEINRIARAYGLLRRAPRPANSACVSGPKRSALKSRPSRCAQ